MSGIIALDRANFVSLWVETIFYGGYSVLFAACVYVLLYANKQHRPDAGVNKPLLATAITMFALSTTHVIVNFSKGIAAFVDNQDTPHGALKYYSQISFWLNIFKQALYATNNIVADALVIYRCYIVWNFSLLVIVGPTILLIATSVCAYLAVYNFSQVSSGDDVFALNIAQWGTALFSLSLVTNITVTTLIAARIWWLSRETAGSLGSQHTMKYNRAIAIILESGAIYSVSLIILLALYCLESNAQYIAYDALSQIMGIVPTLIIVRVGLGISTQSSTTFATATKTNMFSAFESGSEGNSRPRQGASAVGLKFRKMDTTFGSTALELDEYGNATTKRGDSVSLGDASYSAKDVV